MLGSPRKQTVLITKEVKEELLGNITQIEFTIQAVESFCEEDRDTLMKLLKHNVAEARKAILALHVNAVQEPESVYNA